MFQFHRRYLVYVRRPFAKFVDSTYYSDSQLCGGAVTVSFSKTSLGKRCTSYNAPPTSRKRAADRWSLRNFLSRDSLFMVGKAQKSHGVRSGLYGRCSNGVPPIHFFQAEYRIQFKSHPMRFWFFQTTKMELWDKKFRSDQRSAARFWEVGGAL
jgi:hypothetical protein